MGLYKFPINDEEELFLATNDSTFWSALLFPLIFLFGFILLFLETAADFLKSCPVLALLLYIAVSIGIGWLSYVGKCTKRRVFGAVGTAITMLPMGIIEWALIIYTAENNGIDTIFGWIILTVLIVGLTLFVMSLCRFIKNGITHLIVSVVILVVMLFVIFD